MGPRFGFAYDLFGDGKTALRGGWGWFFDTGQNNPFSATIGTPPVYKQPTLYYGNLDTYASSGGALGPQNLTTLYGKHQTPNTMNFSLGHSATDVGHGHRRFLCRAVYRAIFTSTLHQPHPDVQSIRPEQLRSHATRSTLPDNFFRPYGGLGDISAYEHIATANYHSLPAQRQPPLVPWAPVRSGLHAWPRRWDWPTATPSPFRHTSISGRGTTDH